VVAKKTRVRSTRTIGPGTVEPRRNRQVHPAPRPSAAVPVESAPAAIRPPAEATVTRPLQIGRPPTVLRTNRPSRVATTLVEDYRYVVRDLTRIGILAVVAFAVLFGLTFVVH
jgi:hypothetical protein